MKKSRRGEQAKFEVSKARPYEEAGAFWDTHDVADAETRSVNFDVDLKRRRFLVAVDPAILRGVRQRAATRGVSPENLVNLWLKEKLAE